MYYNMTVTSWMNLTSDLQIVYSGLNQAISPTTGKLAGIDTAVVAGAPASRAVLAGGRRNHRGVPMQSVGYQ
jgi:hypothetical protein